MKKIFADFIFDGYTIRHKSALVVNEEGVILEILDEDKFHAKEAEYYPGLICPGFVNAHGHLELSHLKGKMPTGTGLLAFLRGVVTLRDIDQSIIDEAIRLADSGNVERRNSCCWRHFK
ncbi:MAG: hypothetical protein IPH93_04675 [Saprospiraceae bacterium]|nr:hypothetical protein [Saprospiraceae bacterium]